MTDYLIDHEGRVLAKVGDHVENGDVRFYIADINESQQLCGLDRTRPWVLKNPTSPMAACITQGHYAARVGTLMQAHLNTPNGTLCR